MATACLRFVKKNLPRAKAALRGWLCPSVFFIAKTFLFPGSAIRFSCYESNGRGVSRVCNFFHFKIYRMYKLNKPATKALIGLLNRMGDQVYLKLRSEGFLPLTAEKIGREIETPFGKGFLLSLAHYYEQNGDLMRCPEMVFIVVDKRHYPKDFDSLFAFAQLYQQDDLGIYEESTAISNGRLIGFNDCCQRSHISFANRWLHNIQMQGFLK